MKKKYLVILGITFLIVYLGVCFFLTNQASVSDELRKEIVDENDNIVDINISGNSPTMFISFDVIEDIENNNFEDVFLKTREIISNESVFQKIIKYHDEKYGGTITELHISFRYGKDIGDKYIDYYSFNEIGGNSQYMSFKEWYIKVDGKSVKYVENDKWDLEISYFDVK